MNENLNLVEILKDCPEGTKLYSTIFGEVEFKCIKTVFNHQYVIIELKDFLLERINFNGKLYNSYDGECILFPSKDQRNWSKFTAPRHKKDKFNPKTLQPFDKVIARLYQGLWCCELFSFIEESTNLVKCCGAYYTHCVPYNDETKHLVGTTNEAPEYYRYWED